jgi:hypothetical protein
MQKREKRVQKATRRRPHIHQPPRQDSHGQEGDEQAKTGSKTHIQAKLSDEKQRQNRSCEKQEGSG